MKAFEIRSGRSVALVLAGAVLASCVAHGQSVELDPEVYFNETAFGADFYQKLLSGRVNVMDGPRPRYRNVVSGLVFGADGTVYECSARRRMDGKFFWLASDTVRWSTYMAASGGNLIWQLDPKQRNYTTKFYDPETGGLSTEVWWQDANVLVGSGQIQDTWPRALADACPGLKLPAHIKINEKQTSLRMDELRRQDPDAPIRNFPGSHLTSPGRTGLGRSGGKPTTTKAEVEAFLKAQHGNVLINNKRIGLVYVRAGGREELWRIGHWDMTDGFWDVVRTVDEAGEWIEIREGTRVRRRYPMGYPFPYLPTGHRHPAFQLTDEFLAQPYPRPLPHMGEAYADKRFVFHAEGRFSVVDEAGNLVEGPHFDGTWMWTRGRLEMAVRDDSAGPYSVGWRELASDLDMQPTVWTQYTPDRID
ncbi:MAG: hypothetical protein OXN81_05280 [Alphaproteobacteria bacterium]|nr:hypothetical protein [Alphaproteobacteria bacterium]